jgi:hypothetical protein
MFCFFFINVADWDITANPTCVLDLMVDGSSVSYSLCVAIYRGGAHWTARWITSNAYVGAIGAMEAESARE